MNKPLELQGNFEVALRTTRAGLIDALRGIEDLLKVVEQAKRLEPVVPRKRGVWGGFETKVRG